MAGIRSLHLVLDNRIVLKQQLFGNKTGQIRGILNNFFESWANTSPKIYAFIDSQNVNLAIHDCGWELDFARLFIYLNDRYKNVMYAGIF